MGENTFVVSHGDYAMRMLNSRMMTRLPLLTQINDEARRGFMIEAHSACEPFPSVAVKALAARFYPRIDALANHTRALRDK